MAKPSVSIIIPAHNEALLLTKCLTALVNQKESPPFEIIVVDNNSSDNTSQIARSFAARVVREKKQGPAAARNRGIREARSQLLIFVDADCIVAPRHVARINEWFGADPKRLAAAGAYDFYDAPFIIRWFAKKTRLYMRYYRILKSLFDVQILLSGNFAIRKDTMLKVGGFDETFQDIYHSEDTDLAIRLHKAGITVQYLPMMTVRSSHRRIKNFDMGQQVSRLSTHFGYLVNYKMKSS